ncbi:MAG: hypothetical protein LQ349_007781, partial [Xanthoria aureola]
MRRKRQRCTTQLLPTIRQFLDVTGELPVIGHWDASYIIILHELDRQLREWAKRQRVPRVELVGLFNLAGITDFSKTSEQKLPENPGKSVQE